MDLDIVQGFEEVFVDMPRSNAPNHRPLDLLRSCRRVGLVLSGGSSRCSFQVGVVEALEELGVRPALAVGVSGGAWNAAAVAAGSEHRLRYYWRAFSRMPHVDLSNLARQEHSPYIFSELHRRTFSRYVGTERLLRPGALPLLVGLTRLRDFQPVTLAAQEVDDPLALLLASNFLPPFYTRPPKIAGERYADGGFTDNIPYRAAFEHGCDAVVLVTMRGADEPGLYRNPLDRWHTIPSPFRERTVVIQPQRRLGVSFTERRWPELVAAMDLGSRCARETLLGLEAPRNGEPPPTRLSPSALLTRIARRRARGD